MIGSALLYYLVIKPVSLLPYFILYRLSDVLFVVFYYLIPYRKKVVISNLKRSFPEKNPSEIEKICKQFYRHFCDLVLESLKNFSIRPEQIQQRMTSGDTSLIQQLEAQGKSIILCGGHYGNWELWAVAAPRYFHHPLVAIYKQLSKKYFDRKMKASRGKFGLLLVATHKYATYLHTHISQAPFTSVFAFDQSPGNPEKAVWVNFLGQETAAQFGAEKYAKEYDLPVVFGHISKPARGKYHVTYSLVTLHPKSFDHGALTQELHSILEKDIQKNPSLWLWTHKRWKHTRKKND